jgi:Na+/H+ antiporter NhaD/arsenite permease-like protein
MTEGDTPTGDDRLARKGLILVAVTLLAVVLSRAGGFDASQTVSSAVFIMIISSTLLFWPFRLAIAFVGIAALLGLKVLTLRSFIESCELDIILFLVGMMVTVGVLKDLGLFTWIIQSVLRMKRMNGRRFILAVGLLSAAMACIVDEVTSIVFVTALIFQV